MQHIVQLALSGVIVSDGVTFSVENSRISDSVFIRLILQI
jgi:hypothetical protein